MLVIMRHSCPWLHQVMDLATYESDSFNQFTPTTSDFTDTVRQTANGYYAVMVLLEVGSLVLGPFLENVFAADVLNTAKHLTGQHAHDIHVDQLSLPLEVIHANKDALMMCRCFMQDDIMILW